MKKNYIGYVDSVKAEFATRAFSSRKRVIKFIAICFVPFLYAFVCIWAFWNPIPKIGEAPMAIVSNDVPINFVVGKTEAGSKKWAAGEIYKIGEQIIGDEEINIDDIPDTTEIITTAGTKIKKSDDTIVTKASLVDTLIDAWKAGSVENISYNQDTDKFSVKVNDGMTLSNVTYLNGAKAKEIASQNEDGSWDVKDENTYWAQIQMPKRLSSDILGYFDASLQETFKLPTDGEVKAPSDFLNDLRKNSFQFWSTYKHNFLFGQFMYIFNEFKSSLVVDMGPQVISNLVKLIIEGAINSVQENLKFVAPETVDEVLTINGDHGSSDAHEVRFNVRKGDTYVIRNKEFLDAIKDKHKDWIFTDEFKTIEGTTGTEPNKDWGTDGLLSVFASRWNELMDEYGEFLAPALATSITNKINKEMNGLGTVKIDSDGVKKLFSTAGNIAGLLEQDADLIPETDANFKIEGTGVGAIVKNYKGFVRIANGVLHSKYNFISILSSNSDSSDSAYFLPFGDVVKPESGTFNYNLQHDINIITHLILDKAEMLSMISGGSLSGFFPDLGDFVKTNIVGSQFNPYGIGLGQFFLCIGLWVGTLMQTFVFDRAKRIKNAKPWAWYLSKTTLMMVTAWIQTTILMLSVYALGWSVMGASFGLMYLWMMFTATVFVFIQQALWFSIRDETVGKFLIVLLLIINLSSGWGTFPTFMQAPIFNFLSYFAPYTYSMHGQGAIIYSIAVNGANVGDSLYIMQQFGILIVWAVGFLIIGLLCSVLRNREIFYGTYKSKKLGNILIEQDLEKYVDSKTKRVSWKKLPKQEMPDIKKKVKKRYPEEGQYKWFKKWNKKNHPDKPLTASESDDEIIRRNE